MLYHITSYMSEVSYNTIIYRVLKGLIILQISAAWTFSIISVKITTHHMWDVITLLLYFNKCNKIVTCGYCY